MKSIIAVDIDDVLSRSAEGFVQYSNEQWGTDLRADQYDDHWAKMWGISFEEAETRAQTLHASGLVGTYAPFSEAEPVLRSLKQYHDLIIVTSRRVVVKEETCTWVDRYFPKLFSAIYFSGLWDNATEHAVSATKSQVCADLGVDYLIDDQVRHCVGAQEVGAQAILFGDYPWSNVEELPDDIMHCSNWRAVQGYFDEQQSRT